MVKRDLTLQDRCDANGGKYPEQAFIIAYKVINDEQRELLFCGHHGRQHMPRLAAEGWKVDDFTDRINEKPTDPDDEEW